MAITAARKATKTANKGTLAAHAKVLAPKTDKTAIAKLRKGIVPGQVLILLAGQYKGKRVVFLRQLKSGLLLVTGIVGINGVPAKRVNQNYVIVTSTRVNVPESTLLQANESLTDDFFDKAKDFAQKQNKIVKKGGEAGRNQDRINTQKSIEQTLKPALVAMGKEYVSYIGSKVSIPSGSKPHAMKF